MTKKPKGRKYRNLIRVGDAIYYQRREDTRVLKHSLKTDDWDIAVGKRDEYERQRAEDLRVAALPKPPPSPVAPTFAEMAARYLEEGRHRLAGTTHADRGYLLKTDGRILTDLGTLPLDEIRRGTLMDWWQREVDGRARSQSTGRNYLGAISAVFGFAVDREIIESNPVDALRSTLRRRNRTSKGRAEADGARNARPIEKPAELVRFVDASRAIGGAGHVLDMLQLDAGLRYGEAIALRWRNVRFGTDANDTTRCLTIDSSHSRSRFQGPPKSGRTRRVQLSRRLRSLLREWQLRQGKPADDALVAHMDNKNYSRRKTTSGSRIGHFTAVCEQAGIGHRRPKDLRDTYCSQLLTCGVQLPLVSEQLGHADFAVTARHYAKWCAAGAYRRPLEVLPGEVPADLLARIVEERYERDTTRTDAASTPA